MGQAFALDIGPEPVVGELADHRLDPGAAGFHLVERLDGGEPGDGPRLTGGTA